MPNRTIDEVYAEIFKEDQYYVLAQEKEDPIDPPRAHVYAKGTLAEVEQLVRELFRDFTLNIPNADEKIREPIAIFDPEFRSFIWVTEGKTVEEVNAWLTKRMEIYDSGH